MIDIGKSVFLDLYAFSKFIKVDIRAFRIWRGSGFVQKQIRIG